MGSRRVLRAILVLSMALSAGGLLGGCVAEPVPPSLGTPPIAIGSPALHASPSTGDVDIAWNAGTPPPVEPSPSLADAGALEPCSTDQLEARPASLQGAGGSMAGGFTVRTTGARACGLIGRPTIAIVDDAGRRLPVGDVATADPAGRVILLPGLELPPVGDETPVGLASVFLVWSNWCGPDPKRPLRLRVAAPGGGVLEVPMDLLSLPRCDEPGVGSAISVGPFEATTGPDPTDPPAIPAEQLTLTLEVPDRAVAGQTLTYVAILANRTAGPIDVRPCPAFEERLNARGGSIVVDHVLACDAAPVIAPGVEVRFEMRIDVPAAQPADPEAALVWALDPYGTEGFPTRTPEGKVALPIAAATGG